MTYAVTQACVPCDDCVNACPVDCIRFTSKQAVIDPDSCIDCGACVPECALGAALEESHVSASVLEFNRTESARLNT